MQTYCVSAGAGAGWAGPGAGAPPSSVPQCLRSQCGPLRFCWGWSWWTLLFEAGGWRQQPGGPGVRAAKDRPLRVLNSTPPHSVGSQGAWSRCVVLATDGRCTGPGSLFLQGHVLQLPEPWQSGLLALWLRPSVQLSTARPALLPATWKSRKAALPASPVSPGFPPAAAVAGSEAWI